MAEEDSRIAMLESGVVDIVPIGPGNVEKLKDKGFQIKGPQNIISTTIRFLMSYDESFQPIIWTSGKLSYMGQTLP